MCALSPECECEWEEVGMRMSNRLHRRLSLLIGRQVQGSRRERLACASHADHVASAHLYVSHVPLHNVRCHHILHAHTHTHTRTRKEEGGRGSSIYRREMQEEQEGCRGSARVPLKAGLRRRKTKFRSPFFLFSPLEMICIAFHSLIPVTVPSTSCRRIERPLASSSTAYRVALWPLHSFSLFI